MSSEVWERVIGKADGVIWCTHATQAWRQSEAAFWEEMPESLRRHAVLLLTRMDKILDPRDRKRVMARVAAETGDAFRSIHPVSLTRARTSTDTAESGLDAATDAILDIVTALCTPQEPGTSASTEAATAEAPNDDGSGRVVPRRVRRRMGTRSARLSPEEAAERQASIVQG
jgi:hypothetical protein